MKTTFQIVSVFLLFAFGSLSALKAEIIVGDAVLESTPGGSFGDYQVGLAQTTSYGNPTAMGLFGFGIEDLGNDNFQFNPIGIAEATILYLVSPGDRIEPQSVLTNPRFASNLGESPGLLNLSVGESQYFGYYDDRNSEFFDFPDFVSNDDNFGWFRLDRDANGLSISEGATAIGAGITVGTAIPEPTCFTLLIATAMIGSTRRRRVAV